ncbi:MAG: hypothetical protein M5R36_19720 [Deltaproteobacteria bacterium]|nr:hypothetical protein [Deltaproteobacteria bacterium]
MKLATRLIILVLFIAAAATLVLFIAKDKMNPTIDRNNDGKPDVWTHYNWSNEITALEKDRNYDGTVDHKEVFKNGKIDELVVDMNNDGIFEVRSTYDANGKIATMERDLNNDGRYERKT